MNPGPPPNTIRTGLLGRLENDDQVAWLEFFHTVYAAARAAIDHALATPGVPAAKDARRLVRAYQHDPVDIHVALDMAWTSFRSHFLDRNQPGEIQTEADCAALLIRVAYNRWQRQRYRDKQARRQTDLGAARPAGSDGPTLIEQYPDDGPGPEEQVDLADFQAALDHEVEAFTKHLSEVDRQIVHLTFFERLTPREIKERLKISEVKSQEVARLWKRHLRQRYPRTLDFLDPGTEPDPS